jgi:hypothetical protein
MEIDVYLKSDFEKNTLVYKLKQLKPDGRFDEWKYFLGFLSREEVKNKYTNFMNSKMYGGIQEMTWNTFLNKAYLPGKIL